MEIFAARELEKFLRSCVEHIRAKFPGKVESMGEEQALTLARAAVAKAKSLSVSWNDDVLTIVELVFRFGLDFEKTPELAHAMDVLNDDGLEPDVRVGLLAARLEHRSQTEGSRG
jgi:hypothetical protein